MNAQQIVTDIARGIFIRNEIAKLKAELTAIEKRLEAAGLAGDHIPLQDKEREGKQYLALGEDRIIPVRFESDQLISSFKPDSTLHKTIAAILGNKLSKFFKDTRVFQRVQKEDANKFRKLAREVLDPDDYAKLINACISRDKAGIAKSKTVVAWDDSKPIEQIAAP
jgi:hypothetical protein